jgi:hypothetical protein
VYIYMCVHVLCCLGSEGIIFYVYMWVGKRWVRKAVRYMYVCELTSVTVCVRVSLFGGGERGGSRLCRFNLEVGWGLPFI